MRFASTFLLAILLFLTSCVGFEKAEWYPNGSPMKYTAVDHFMSKSDGSATERKMAFGGITSRSAHTRPDSTEVPRVIASAAVQAVGLKAYFKNEEVKSAGEAQSNLKATKDPNHIPVDPHKEVPPGNPNYVPPPVEPELAPAPTPTPSG
jgi:hypothetical protein